MLGLKIIAKRELNQQTAKVLADVDEGETIIVTERGVPRWRIERAHVASDPLEHWRRLGLLTPSRADPEPWPDDQPAPGGYSIEFVQDRVDETRGER